MRTLSPAIQRALADLATSITRLLESPPHALFDAVEHLQRSSTIYVTGIGKSSFVAMKMAATLTSLGVSARYIDAVSAMHGDAGTMNATDTLVVFSKSGETTELLPFMHLVKELSVPIVALCNRPTSTLALLANVVVPVTSTHEFDDESLVPTSSVALHLAYADCLAVMTASSRPSRASFGSAHPGGLIGALTSGIVSDAMHANESLPMIDMQATVTHALVTLSTSSLGIVCIVDDDNRLLGVITDGDIRRLVARGLLDSSQRALDIATTQPITIASHASLTQALSVMEEREKPLNVLPVLDGDRCVGVLRLHDILRRNVVARPHSNERV
jgi:arabinose-5-phosphate isomerase